jgi:pectate lyase
MPHHSIAYLCSKLLLLTSVVIPLANLIGCDSTSRLNQFPLDETGLQLESELLDTSGEDRPEAAADCSAIEEQPEWELCGAAPQACAGIFYDNTGCEALCASVGMSCSQSRENIDGECTPNMERLPLDCENTGHQSDWCFCTGDGEVEYEPPPSGQDTKGLLDGLMGYAEGSTGGLGGAVCTVENLNDSGPGSLRDCAEASGAKWIVFAIDGDIYLKSNIQIQSDKTIDGSGRYIRIYQNGINISSKSNIVIHNLIFKQGNGGEDNDAITIRNGSHHIWIDHCSFSDYGDGLVDIKEAATDITVSWSKFSNHDKVMLISASTNDTGDTDIRVTLHHNWFHETTQRHPRLRFGRAHIFNNYFDNWKSYGIGCSYKGQCRSENNIFEAGADKDAIIDQVGTDSAEAKVRSDGDWLGNGAKVIENDRSSVFDPNAAYSYTLQGAGTALRDDIIAHGGWQ